MSLEIGNIVIDNINCIGNSDFETAQLFLFSRGYEWIGTGKGIWYPRDYKGSCCIKLTGNRMIYNEDLIFDLNSYYISDILEIESKLKISDYVENIFSDII